MDSSDNPRRFVAIKTGGSMSSSSGSRPAKRFKSTGYKAPRVILAAKSARKSPAVTLDEVASDAEHRTSRPHTQTVRKTITGPATAHDNATMRARPRSSQPSQVTEMSALGSQETKTPGNNSQTPARRVSTMVPQYMDPPASTLKTPKKTWPILPIRIDEDDASMPRVRRVAAASAMGNRRGHPTHTLDVPKLAVYPYLERGLLAFDEDPDEMDVDDQILNGPRQEPRKYARKISEDFEPPESDSDRETTPDDDDDDDDDNTSSDDSEIQVIEPPTLLINAPAARIKVDKVPTRALVDTLKGCVIHLPERRLPFIRRNLRVGFQSKCKARGVFTTVLPDENVSVQATYVYRNGEALCSFATSLAAWTCPLCLLHRKLVNRYVLQKHLDWDHGDVKVRWVRGSDDGRVTKWDVEVTLPAPRAPVLNKRIHPHFAYATYAYNPIPLIGDTSQTAVNQVVEGLEGIGGEANVVQREPTDKGKGKARDPSIYSESTTSATRDSTTFTTIASGSTAEATPFTRESTSTHASSTTATSLGPSTNRSSAQTTITKQSRSISPPLLFPALQAVDSLGEDDEEPDILGPTAKYPYLPARTDDGKTIGYSCRIGGPKIYDLLGTLSLEPFGALRWVVLDREEEIFEVDDMKDEHKVMHALWARWILLNRNTFVRNYFDGVKCFIDSYYKMIQLAAGREALRYWLLLLLPLKFLNGRDVAELLKHYQAKVEANRDRDRVYR
ncbi:hypothetical protein V5O48_000386 [Marasmius crinis-equi]|uniref:Polycomb protein VEFS-Box domain-containing protein n=1 Tax=Marasmius crinis-equi TaxID=585013 RepID=A0ABR3G1G0_9AGAR